MSLWKNAGLASLGAWFLLATAHAKPPSAATMKESDPDYPMLSALKWALEKKDERKLKMIVNSLKMPLKARGAEDLKATSLAQVEALYLRLGISKTDPTFQHFMDLYLMAPMRTADLEGYDDVDRPKNEISTAEKAFEKAKLKLAPGEKVLLGGADGGGGLVLFTGKRMLVNEAWYPTTTKQYSNSVAYSSEGGTLVIERPPNPSSMTPITFNGQDMNAWPIHAYEPAFLDSVPIPAK